MLGFVFFLYFQNIPLMDRFLVILFLRHMKDWNFPKYLQDSSTMLLKI